MPTLYITEYGGLQATPSSPAMNAPVAPSLADQAIAIGASSAQSAAMSAQTRLVRLFADAKCFVKFGTDPTVTTNLPLEAGVAEYFQVPAGAGTKVAVITRA